MSDGWEGKLLDKLDRLIAMQEQDAIYRATFSYSVGLSPGQEQHIVPLGQTSALLLTRLTDTVTVRILGQAYTIDAPGGLVPVFLPGADVYLESTASQVIHLMGMDGRTAKIAAAMPLFGTPTVVVTNTPAVTVSNTVTTEHPVSLVMSGSATVTAGGTILPTAFTAPADGTVYLTLSLTASSVVDAVVAGAPAAALNSGTAIPSAQVYNDSLSLTSGATLQLSAGSATTVWMQSFWAQG